MRAWATATSIYSYHSVVSPALLASVSSFGSGPWGAGLWWGDSQLSLLAAWIGQAIAARSWARAAAHLDGIVDAKALAAAEANLRSYYTTPPLDYYIYSTFTENPGALIELITGPRRTLAYTAVGWMLELI